MDEIQKAKNQKMARKRAKYLVKEEKRMVFSAGYAAKHDAAHGQGELLRAAVAYFMYALRTIPFRLVGLGKDIPEQTQAQEHAAFWWPKGWAKLTAPPQELTALARGIALAQAELERRLRTGEGGEQL